MIFGPWLQGRWRTERSGKESVDNWMNPVEIKEL
jgi:hypothetical protein